jgi:predicted alpha/beta-hydrolase family hydrolase
VTQPTAFDIDVGVSGMVTGLHYPSAPTTGPGVGAATLLLAPGAGAPQSSGFMTAFAHGLCDRGLDVVTFNFVYLERGRRAPDARGRLEYCYHAAIDTTRTIVPSARTRLVVGGKSMGGRIASQVVAADADDLSVAGLVFLGYPLHPPGRPEKRRDTHLPDITAPMLFVQGSRDPFGTESEIQSVVDACARAQLWCVAGGDHSLKVRGREAPPLEATYTEVQDTIADWVTSLRNER